MHLKTIAFVFLIGLELYQACDMDQMYHGCRIINRSCTCGYGCASEYRYDSIGECQAALKGTKRDPCKPNPCMHGGSCIQTSHQTTSHKSTHHHSALYKYKCMCEGTGYFGLKCNRECPIPGGPGSVDIFPHECIVI